MRSRFWGCAAAVVLLALVGGAWWATRGPRVGEVRINPKDGAEMVWVPAGEFLVGSSDEDISTFLNEHPGWKAESVANETPQRKVYLSGYWMYKYEVTVKQYRKFCKVTGRKMPDAPDWGWKDNHPIVNVSWDDASTYAKWARASLPTEAQWEKAARGTDGRTYPWGSKWPPPAGSGNFRDRSYDVKHPRLVIPMARTGCPPIGCYDDGYDDGYAGTSPVGAFPADASPYGCMDMAGNALEWCGDWYGNDYYKSAPFRNPKGPGASPTLARVWRGESYGGADFRCAARHGCMPAITGDSFGFRCARNPD